MDLIKQYDEATRDKFKEKTSLIEIIHGHLQEQELAKRDKYDPKKFYPSSAGMCSRRIVYQMMGFPGEISNGRGLLILENGNYFHSRIESILGDTGLLISPELSFKKEEWRVSGRSDAIIHNFLEHEPSTNIITLKEAIYDLDEKGEAKRGEDGHRIILGEKVVYEGPDNDVIIVELKSISDSGFKYLDRTGGKDGHKKQLQLYMHLTGIKMGMLLYENKNTQEMKEYFVPYDPEMAQVIIDQIILVNKCVDEGTFPEKEYDQLSFECRYCPYSNICWPIKYSFEVTNI